MSLKNLNDWVNAPNNKPNDKPTACGADDKPTACGANDK